MFPVKLFHVFFIFILIYIRSINAIPNHDQGVTWKANLDEKFENTLVYLAQRSSETRREFFDQKTQKTEQKNEEKGNFFCGALYLNIRGKGLQGPFIIGPDIANGGKQRPLFCVSGIHSFRKYYAHNEGTGKCPVIGLKDEAEPKKYKASVETKFKELYADLKETLPKLCKALKVPARFDLSGFEESFDEMFQGFNDTDFDDFSQQQSRHTAMMLDEIRKRYDQSSLSFRSSTVNTITPFLLHKLSALAKTKNKESDFYHSDQYFFHRLTHQLGDEYDEMIYLPIILKKIYVSIWNGHRRTDTAEFPFIDNVYLLCTSTNDMCYRCAISLSREYSRNDLGGIHSMIKDTVYRLHSNFPFPIEFHNVRFNIFVGSMNPWYDETPGPNQKENRRQRDYENDDIDYDKLFDEGKIVQWIIPPLKLYHNQ